MDERLTLVEHLDEVRARLLKSVVFVIIVSCVLYSIIGALMPILIRPVKRLVFIAPQEAFVVNIKIAFLGGIFFSSPYLLYQVWQFVSVALEKKERKHVFVFGLLSFVLFLLGCSFGYFVILPIAMKFLLGFATDAISPMITVSKYVSFVGTIVFAFSFVFQLPLIMLFLTKIGMVTPVFLSKKRRHAIVGMFVAAAILTPPDVITQCLMAGPLLVLYEIGIMFSKWAYRPA
ncbi:MAG: twin-arginine translocase subunit TatC [Candidatus Omnitrophica bacterium]|nr:twin-arginine translocase subunit TatC [Candidatus Omnitrophota bacterium]